VAQPGGAALDAKVLRLHPQREHRFAHAADKRDLEKHKNNRLSAWRCRMFHSLLLTPDDLLQGAGYTDDPLPERLDGEADTVLARVGRTLRHAVTIVVVISTEIDQRTRLLVAELVQ
jgi:hypothetical protein